MATLWQITVVELALAANTNQPPASDSSDIHDLLIGTLGSVLAALLWFWLPFAITRYVYARAHDERCRFLGFSRAAPRMCIYSSRLHIGPGGASAPHTGALPPRGYRGVAVSALECKIALDFQRALHSPVPMWLQRLIRMVPVEPEWEISPDGGETSVRHPGTNLVLLGSDIYNMATKYYHKRATSRCFTTEKTANGYILRVLAGPRTGHWFSRQGEHRSESDTPAHPVEVGFVQRIRDGDSSIFICAGRGTGGTYAAAWYLINEWNRIRTRCGNNEFALLLVMKGLDPNPTSVPIFERSKTDQALTLRTDEGPMPVEEQYAWVQGQLDRS
jgi:hypothetical protein